MTTKSYDDVEARLRACLEHMARSVSDEPPAFSSREHSRVERGRRNHWGPALLASVAVVIGLAAVVGLRTTAMPRAQLIAATKATIEAQTARVRLTSLPSRVAQVGQNAVGMTATGVVDFAVPSMEAAYPDGYSWVDIAGRSWNTVWPEVPGAVRWEVSTPAKQGPRTSAAERELGQSLEPDTGPTALLAALRAGTQRVTELGPQTLEGLRASRYRAVIGRLWSADVWVAGGRLLRVEVEGPSGLAIEDYYDYGVSVSIQRPPQSRAQPRR